MNSSPKPESVSKGIIPAFLATALYGLPFWLLLNIFGEKDKAIIQQESWLVFCLVFGVCFLSFANYRVYKLSATIIHAQSISSWLKLALVGPWQKPD